MLLILCLIFLATPLFGSPFQAEQNAPEPTSPPKLTNQDILEFRAIVTDPILSQKLSVNPKGYRADLKAALRRVSILHDASDQELELISLFVETDITIWRRTPGLEEVLGSLGMNLVTQSLGRDSETGLSSKLASGVKWIRMAAEAGDPNAQFELGNKYSIGQGVAKDPAEAVKWYRKSAEQGVVLSQVHLGEVYRFGEDVPQDYAEALRWFRMAANWHESNWRENANLPPVAVEAGLAFVSHTEGLKHAAEVQLGHMYSRGEGVPKDYAEAANWYRKAAEEKDADGQYFLGDLYWFGQGVPKDYVQANMWLNLSAAQGNSAARDGRDNLEKLMTPSQIAEAQEMARNWRPGGTAESGSPDNPSHTTVPASPQIAATGTGFFVNRQGYILTNYHVIEGCAAMKIQSDGDRSLSVIAQDKSNDLALLRTAGGFSQAATFSGGPAVRVGQSVIAVGYPLRGLLSSGANVTTGNVSAIAGPHDDTGLLQMTAPVQPGNSGGPLLDQSGNVIGVVVAKLDALKIASVTGDIPQNVNFAIKGTVVRTFLETSGVEFASAPSNVKLDPAVVAERATKFTQVVECWK